MRSFALAAAISAIAAGACARRPPSPAVFPGALARGASDPMPPEDRIRVVSAPSIRVVSAASPPAPAATSTCGEVRRHPACKPDPSALRAPHRVAEPAPPPLRTPLDLRHLVGRRDKRDPLAAVAAWSRELGAPLATATGDELVSWATEAGRLRPATETPLPGDLLVFDQATSDDPADLVALVVERDARGATEFVYLAAGIVRRGLVDATRPSLHRDGSGATVNTFLRHGRRWPAPGTRYLAGELLGHIVRMR
ncbi:MAG TPA: hypothetical protein VK932_22000 [Kofleriaceae bacterium]|nr:hypothetical protein [Kofleriaceae bacterium]